MIQERTSMVNTEYSTDFSVAARRILTHCDLDINSPSCGSFDRYFWGWKKRDFDDSTLLFSLLPLLKYQKLTGQPDDLHFICDCFLKNLRKLKHSNYSYDQSYPNEMHPKIALDFTAVLHDLLKRYPKDTEVLREIYLQIINYSLKSEEEYGVICNHLAHHAYEYLLAWECFGEQKFYLSAMRNLDIIRSHTHDEGWHLEYMAGDPGYQTRALKYLTKCIDLLQGEARLSCLNLCRASMDFLDKVVMPDGTLYGMFGSRNTEILYPSGLEKMALLFPLEYASLPTRVRHSVVAGRAISPLQLDYDNFIRLFDDYLDAHILVSSNEKVTGIVKPRKSFDLPSFGFAMFDVNDANVYVHYKFGGAVAIYQGQNLIAKDAGLLLETKKGQYLGTRNIKQQSIVLERNLSSITMRTPLFPSIHKNVTPLQLVMLRLLNLTCLRIKWIAGIFRKLIVKILMTGRCGLLFGHATRTMTVEHGKVHVRDEIETRVSVVSMWRCAKLHLFHMASSRVFNPADQHSSTCPHPLPLTSIHEIQYDI